MRTAPLDYALYMLAGYCFPANTPFETLALRASVRESKPRSQKGSVSHAGMSFCPLEETRFETTDQILNPWMIRENDGSPCFVGI